MWFTHKTIVRGFVYRRKLFKDLTLWTQPEIISMSSFSRFVHCLACSSTEYIRIWKVCFQYMNLGSLYFVSLSKTSCREMLLTTLNAPVTTWSAELYIWTGNSAGEIRVFRLVETWLVCDDEYCLGSWHQDLWRQAKV